MLRHFLFFNKAASAFKFNIKEGTHQSNHCNQESSKAKSASVLHTLLWGPQLILFAHVHGNVTHFIKWKFIQKNFRIITLKNCNIIVVRVSRLPNSIYSILASFVFVANNKLFMFCGAFYKSGAFISFGFKCNIASWLLKLYLFGSTADCR